MKKTIVFSMALAIGFFVSNCKKDEDSGGGTPTVKRTKAEMLTDSTWIITSLKVAGVEFWSTYDECERDNEFDFGTNNILTTSEGALVCKQSDPGPWEASYSLNSDTTMIFIGQDSSTIESITPTKMIFSRMDGSSEQVVTYEPK